jgi:hypothetical protein
MYAMPATNGYVAPNTNRYEIAKSIKVLRIANPDDNERLFQAPGRVACLRQCADYKEHRTNAPALFAKSVRKGKFLHDVCWTSSGQNSCGAVLLDESTGDMRSNSRGPGKGCWVVKRKVE